MKLRENLVVVLRNKGGNSRPTQTKTHSQNNNHTTLWEAVEAVEAFKQAMIADGLGAHDVKPDDGLQRRRHQQDRAGTKNIYFEFFSLPIPAGYYGCFKRDIYQTWCSKSESTFTDEEKKAFADQVRRSKEKRRQEQAERHKEAEHRALSIWKNLYPANKNHRYIKNNHMGTDNLRQGNKSIVAPLYQNKKIVGLQFITEDGGKKLLTGSKLKGSYFLWGDIKKPFDTAYICEGISTGFALHKLSGDKIVFCAFSASNMLAVALKVREAFPDIEIIIGADNDVRDNEKAVNTGVKYATEAAKAVNGKVSIPQMPDGSKCDWNDLYVKALEQAEVSV